MQLRSGLVYPAVCTPVAPTPPQAVPCSTKFRFAAPAFVLVLLLTGAGIFTTGAASRVQETVQDAVTAFDQVHPRVAPAPAYPLAVISTPALEMCAPAVRMHTVPSAATAMVLAGGSKGTCARLVDAQKAPTPALALKALLVLEVLSALCMTHTASITHDTVHSILLVILIIIGCCQMLQARSKVMASLPTSTRSVTTEKTVTVRKTVTTTPPPPPPPPPMKAAPKPRQAPTTTRSPAKAPKQPMPDDICAALRTSKLFLRQAEKAAAEAVK